MNRIEYYSKAYGNLGLRSLANLEKEKRLGQNRAMRLTSKYLDHPVIARPNTSDLKVFAQIFALREYRCLDDLNDPRRPEMELEGLIVDLGANVGYSAAYFLSKFPKCRVVSVEPFRPNFEMLRKNLAPYGERVVTIEAAVMPGASLVTLDTSQPGEEWGVTVKPSSMGTIPTISIPDILNQSRMDSIALLKIDIEGAEKHLFEADTSWLESVENIVIELHGEDCEKAFFSKIHPTRYVVKKCDELTVCVSRNPGSLKRRRRANALSGPVRWQNG